MAPIDAATALVLATVVTGGSSPVFKVRPGERGILSDSSMAGCDEMELGNAWDVYLQGLVTPQGPVSPFRLKQLRDLWGYIERTGVVPYPHALLGEDGTFAMSWDKGAHHFEIEVTPEGRYGWFYMDRSSDERAGKEDLPLSLFTPEMFVFLRRTIA